MTLLIAPQLIKPLCRYGIKHAALFDGLSGYLSHTPASSTALVRTMTYSCWRRRAKLGGNQTLIEAGVAASNMDKIEFTSADKIRVKLFNGGDVTTVAVFRDPTAFMHIHVAFDLTNAVAADRIRISVNGVLQAVTGTSASNADFYYFKTTAAHKIGDSVYSAGAYFFGGYAAEDILTEAVLGPEHFGETDDATGQWKAKRYTGPYGTNGFHLDFSTASNLGEDTSGNGNDWTVNGAVTQVTSTPTNVYATLNFLKVNAQPQIFSEGNTRFLSTAVGTNPACTSTLRIEQGMKVRWEVQIVAQGSGSNGVGICEYNMNIEGDVYAGWLNNQAFYYQANGTKRNGSFNSAYGATWTTGDVIAVELDLVTQDVEFFKQTGGTGAFVSQGVAFTGLSAAAYLAYSPVYNNGDQRYRFAEVSWGGAASSGFTSLCTHNLPAVIGKNVNAHFKTVLFEGTRASQSIGGIGFQPGFIWVKRRDGYQEPSITDAVRGVNSQLRPAHTAAASAQSDCITSFDADGFTLGADNTNNSYNYYLDSHVAWAANLPSTAVPSGYGETISLTGCRSNVTLGMAVVTYTGNGIAGATIPHPLAKKPGMVIVKKTNAAGSWVVQHSSVGATGAMFLETTDAVNANAVWWNNTEPTTTRISLGTNGNVNANGSTYIAYIFAPSDFIKIGSYVGNGSVDGPFINSGISPVFDLAKSIGVENWIMLDDARPGYNPTGNYLFANLSNPEGGAGGQYYDFTATGRKTRTIGASANSSGVTYVYMQIGQPTGGSNIRPAAAR